MKSVRDGGVLPEVVRFSSRNRKISSAILEKTMVKGGGIVEILEYSFFSYFK